MKRWWGYLKYIVYHKWLVFLNCIKLGIPWQGILHDIDKFRHQEFIPGAQYLFGKDGKPKASLDTPSDSFLEVVKEHRRNNAHHPLYWLLDGEPIPMPPKYIKEMIADWVAKAKQNQICIIGWYQDQRDKAKLHRNSRKLAERFLAEIQDITQYNFVEQYR